MEDLRELIKVLSKQEARVIRDYLRAYSSNGKEDTKSLKLFESILKTKNKTFNDSHYAQLIFGTEPDGAYRTLKSRFRPKMLDALVLDFNIERNGVAEPVDKAWFKALKKQLQFNFIYRTKGNKKIAYRLLDEMETIAREFELYAVLLEVLRFKKYLTGITKGIQEFKKINKEISFIEYCQQAFHKANDYYFQIILQGSSKIDFENGEYTRKIREIIYELEKDFSLTKSSSLNYYRKLIEIHYFNEERNYEASEIACEEFLNTVKTNPAVRRKMRLAAGYSNLCTVNICLGKYLQATSFGRKAVEFLPKGNNNYFIGSENYFFALFRNQSNQECLNLLDKLISESKKGPGINWSDKFQFYKAATCFQAGDFKKSLKILQQKFRFERDKTELELQVRLVEILSYIELNESDAASRKINLLYKGYYLGNKKDELTPRWQQILRLLYSFSHKGLVFNDLSVSDKKIITKLYDPKSPSYWDPITSEIIPVHKWFQEKTGLYIELPGKEKVFVS